MKTAAGKTCTVSGKRITSILDGKCCQRCQAAFHNDIIGGMHCPENGKRFKETETKLGIVSIKDLNSENAKSSARFNRRLDPGIIIVDSGTAALQAGVPTEFTMEFYDPTATSAPFPRLDASVPWNPPIVDIVPAMTHHSRPVAPRPSGLAR